MMAKAGLMLLPVLVALLVVGVLGCPASTGPEVTSRVRTEKGV